MQSWDINEYSDIYLIKKMANWILWLLALILPLMAWITLPYWLTKKFGQSNWFYIGMLFLTHIFFWILAFSDAKYEWVEFNEKYSWKKWLLITLWISLLIGCWNAWIKYKEFKDFDKLYSLNYDYEVGDENNNITDDTIKISDFNEESNENYDLNEDLLVVSDEVKNEIKDNTDSEEVEGSRINYDDIKKDSSWYKPTNKKWIDEIAKDYKWNIIMWGDFVDEIKDWSYSVYTKIKKRTLYINDEYNFALMIWPEKIGYTMEISYNDINEPSSIHFINWSGNWVQQTIIYPREDCGYIKDWWNNLEFNDDYIFVTDFPSYYDGFTPVRIITDIKDVNQKKEIVDRKDYCGLFNGVVFSS